MSLVSMRFRGEILGMFGVSAGGWNMPPLGADAIAVIIAYFLLGYFFYAALYAAIGAMVSSEQEAQQAQTPVILMLMVPMICVQLVSANPRGGSAQREPAESEARARRDTRAHEGSAVESEAVLAVP